MPSDDSISRALQALDEYRVKVGEGLEPSFVPDEHERQALAVAWFDVVAHHSASCNWQALSGLRSLAKELLGRDLHLEERDLVRILLAAARTDPMMVPLAHVLRQLDGARSRDELSKPVRAAAMSLRAARAPVARTQEAARELLRLDTMLGLAHSESLPEAGEPWSERALADLAEMSGEDRANWEALFEHLAAANSAQPSKSWLESSRRLLQNLGTSHFEALVAPWFALVQKPATLATREGYYGQPEPAPPISDRNGNLLRGLVWCCATFASPGIVAHVGDLAVVCFTKIAGFGPVSSRVGNACVYTLGSCPGLDGVAQLARLKTRVKYAVANRLIDKAFDVASKRTGFGREELEDLSVPTYGFTAPGVGESSIGAWTARIEVSTAAEVSLRWRSADKKEQASVPAELTRDHAAEVKALKKQVKDIGTMLAAQRLRLEGMLGGRTYSLTDYRARLLNHPLLSLLVRRLIAEIDRGGSSTLALWVDGAFTDQGGRSIDDLRDDDRVRLWHPIGSDVATVKAWRGTLEDRGITQPFKQAHREIYVLTDAERATGTYSNRFAAHILRQHVLAALFRERGWSYRLQGSFDGYNVPSKAIPGTDLSAEFVVEPPEHAEAEASGSGIYLLVRSDHARFYRAGRIPVPLAEVPSLVFSETMRDIDLFVALSSIGSDPNWLDHGHATFADYWRGAAFGELTPSAATRRDVLERLVPRLKIADRCTLSDRFLLVRGKRRTYKIHLGSANILMEPNDQYLCIVPGRSAASKAPTPKLPFEGDSTLSLILSKALLLASDETITDPSILSQIGSATENHASVAAS